MFNFLKCSKNHKKRFSKYEIKRFGNTYEFCYGDINKPCFMLRKGISSYEYWIVGKDLMKHYYLIKKVFIVI